MSRVKVIYLEEGGLFRKKRGAVNESLPNYLLNTADKQAHVLREGPIMAEARPVKVQTFRELVEADIPRQPRQVESRMVFCEVNNPWPISPTPFQDPLSRDADIDQAGEEASQKAILQASREDGGGGTLSKGAYAGAAVVAGVFAILIVIILLPLILERYA